MKEEVRRVLEVIALTLELLLLIAGVVGAVFSVTGDLIALGLAAVALAMGL